MCDAAELLGLATVNAINEVHLRTGFDPLSSGDFWETWIAQQLGGEQTAKKAPYDVSVEIWGRVCLAEVKFSRAFFAAYGKHSRYIFKWALTHNQVRDRVADAIILIGLDQDRSIYSWVLPQAAVPVGKKVITTTAPSNRRPTIVGRIDPYVVPVTEVLPAFAHACHNRHDAPARAQGIAARRPLPLLDATGA